MTKFMYDIPEHDTLWGHTDILNNDLENLEYGKGFSSDLVHASPIDEESGSSLLNFPEEEQDNLYLETEDEQIEEDSEEIENDDNTFEDRNSYRDADQDDMYYFI
jgi:hypothetical protein